MLAGMSRPIVALPATRFPLLQAPMAGVSDVRLAIAVARAGGLGSLPCAMLNLAQVRESVATFRAAASGPLNLNFFCHAPPSPNPGVEAAWQRTLAPYYEELGAEPAAGGTEPTAANRAPFDEETCALVEALRPEVVSFHFGLPAAPLLERVRATGAAVIGSATTVAEALWLEQHGCDAVIAQGLEAGGHRGMFLADDIATQVGMMALLPQVATAVRVPVIAAGGIMDARGIEAAFALGAAAVQPGTAFLRCPECATSPVHRRALAAARDDATVLTNIFTGRPARGLVNRFVRELGAMRTDVPAFPRAAPAFAPLRALAESRGSGEFSPLWAGQGAPLAREIDAATLTGELGEAASRRPWMRRTPCP
jgi:nitronate monooxygenase